MDPVSSIWQIAWALVAIIAVVMLLGYVARRIQLHKPTSGKQMQILDTTYLGPKEKIVLLRVADQQILFGINTQCITKLAQFDAKQEFSKTLENVQAQQG